ncbi:MAG: EAL domain-containing protein [Pseudomonadota bacterium]
MIRELKTVLPVALLVLVSGTTAWAHPEVSASAAQPLEWYRVAQGMSQANVQALTQDAVGYLWAATQRGLTRFDGAAFESITVRHGLRHNDVQSLLVDRRNRLWAGDAFGGLSRVEGLRVTATVGPDSEVLAPVSAIVEVAGRIYVGSRGNGISVVEDPGGEPRQRLLNFQPKNVDDLVPVGRRSLLARSGEALYLFDLALPAEAARRVGEGVSALAKSKDGQVLVGGQRGQLGRWEDGELVWDTELADQPIVALGHEGGDQVWVATETHVWPVASPLRAMEVPEVVDILADREGVIWFGTGSGLVRYLGSRIDHYWLDLLNDSAEIFSIAQTASGTMYFGGTDGLVSKAPDGTQIRLTSTLGLPRGSVRGLQARADGDGVWVGIRNAGLYLLSESAGSARLIEPTQGLSILDVRVGPAGNVWLGTRDAGMLRYAPQSGELLRLEVPNRYAVYTLTFEDNRWLWYAVDNAGVYRIDLTDPELRPALMMSAAAVGKNHFNQLAVADDGIWIAMSEGGLFHLTEQGLTSPGAGPIEDQSVYVVQPLPDGTIVVGSETGVYQLDPATKDYFHYGRLNGFLGVETNVHATLIDADGHLWIGTMEGAARFRTDMPLPLVPSPAAEVISMEAGEDRVPVANGGQVAAGLQRVHINFGAVSTQHPDRLEYSYRLLGADESWVEVGNARSVSYSNLAAGLYRFQVKASKPSGTWGAPSEWTFTVLTPLWKKNWFLGALVVTLLISTIVLMRYRTRLIARANRRLREEVADRTRSIERARQRLEESNRQLEYQASYDELTGIYNRRSFEDRLGEAWTEADNSGVGGYLMYLDLDQFKVVNDTCGHAAGDEVLRQVAELIQAQVRSVDTVGRLGGDEFGIVLKNCPAEAALRVAETVRRAVEDYQFTWGSDVFRIGVSIGVVPIDCARGDINELQQLADAACYAAKEAGRNQVHFVTDDSDQAQKHRGEMRWVHRLRDAMDSNRFALFEQKIMPLNDGREPERVEILLRMRDPATRKLIPPGAFLPAAERYGLSIKLDEWVVTNLLRSLFVHESFSAEGRRYWVNLSGLSMGDHKFCETLLQLMRSSPLPPGMVNFEITETAVIRNVAEASSLIAALREMGCEFALDDFGSGLSSFGYLKKLKVDYIKIDGMFVRDIVEDKTDRIFVKSIIDIAHTLNIKTIAEFVENDDILNIVKSLGADYAQGFGVHRPQMLAPQFPLAPPDVSSGLG